MRPLWVVFIWNLSTRDPFGFTPFMRPVLGLSLVVKRLRPRLALYITSLCKHISCTTHTVTSSPMLSLLSLPGLSSSHAHTGHVKTQKQTSGEWTLCPRGEIQPLQLSKQANPHRIHARDMKHLYFCCGFIDKRELFPLMTVFVRLVHTPGGAQHFLSTMASVCSGTVRIIIIIAPPSSTPTNICCQSSRCFLAAWTGNEQKIVERSHFTGKQEIKNHNCCHNQQI